MSPRRGDERVVTPDGVVVDEVLAHAGAAASLAPAGPLRAPGQQPGRGLVPGLRSAHPLSGLLPALMQADDVSVRWVSGLDEVLAPIISTIDNLDAYVDPRTAPEDWLAWLGQWVGLPALELDTPHLRRAVGSAGDLQALRGTAEGLRAQARITLRCEVEVTDNGGAAWSAAPGGELPGTAEDWVRVRVVSVEEGAAPSEASLRGLVAEAVPAQVRVEIDMGVAG